MLHEKGESLNHLSVNQSKNKESTKRSGAVQSIQEVTWLAPNAWTLSHDCEWFGKFVAICGILRWSTLNLVRCLLYARKLEYCFQQFICNAFDQ